MNTVGLCSQTNIKVRTGVDVEKFRVRAVLLLRWIFSKQE